MRYFTQSIRITPNKQYGVAPIFTGKSEMNFDNKRLTLAMRNKNSMYGAKEYESNMPVFVHQFDGVSPLMIDFKWEIDPVSNKIKESEMQRREAAVLMFLKNHENIISKKDILANGNPVRNPSNSNLRLPIFIMEILEDSLLEKIDLWDKELKVRNIVGGMTEDERIELCYFYGLNPKNMIDMQSKIVLAGQSGIIFEGDNLDKFFAIMSDGNSYIKEIFNKVLFNKCLNDGIIIYTDNQYRIENGATLGMREQDVYETLNNDRSIRDMLSNRVNQNKILFMDRVKKEYSDITDNYKDLLDLSFEEKKKWALMNKVPHSAIIQNEKKLDLAIKDFIIQREMGKKMEASS